MQGGCDGSWIARESPLLTNRDAVNGKGGGHFRVHRSGVWRRGRSPRPIQIPRDDLPPSIIGIEIHPMVVPKSIPIAGENGTNTVIHERGQIQIFLQRLAPLGRIGDTNRGDQAFLCSPCLHLCSYVFPSWDLEYTLLYRSAPENRPFISRKFSFTCWMMSRWVWGTLVGERQRDNVR